MMKRKNFYKNTGIFQVTICKLYLVGFLKNCKIPGHFKAF